jgi:hypothetical protein
MHGKLCPNDGLKLGLYGVKTPLYHLFTVGTVHAASFQIERIGDVGWVMLRPRDLSPWW